MEQKEVLIDGVKYIPQSHTHKKYEDAGNRLIVENKKLKAKKTIHKSISICPCCEKLIKFKITYGYHGCSIDVMEGSLLDK